MFKINPLSECFITSKYGPRQLQGTSPFHIGVDFRAKVNTPYYAVADGVVKVSKVDGSGLNNGYGIYIVVEHDGFCTLGAHLVRLGLPVGTKVKAGDVIGYTGNTGKSTGPHLHFEVIKGKYGADFFKNLPDGTKPNRVDPEPLLLQKDLIEEIVDKLIKHEIVSNKNLWVKVLKKERAVDPDWLITTFVNTIKKLESK
jgi:murein DD-endopeptidase MepM/ murein hydrolase activator NlpD